MFSVQKLCLDANDLDTTLLKKCLTDQKHAMASKDEIKFMESDRNFHIGFTRLTKNNYLIDMMFGLVII